jgi:type I restriction enzyme M protein
MLTSDTKRHIDAARQVLVGIVPDPKGQVDQITNALIYKFMDDMDQSAIRAGGKASFFIKDLEKYSWTSLMSSQLGNQEKMNMYVEAIAKFGDANQLPDLFRDIFKRAFLPYRDPETLVLFLKEISYFSYSHSEELGNAYEYLLSIMGSQGDAGQFRTPRHIIDFMVAVVDPGKDDTVLDPACGTAGFLISAYKHILAKHDGKDNETGKPNKKEKPLTPDERRKVMEHFTGYDISPDMVRMSQVNMYLHAFKKPKIYEYNTLASDDRWNEKFDVMLANPPFMSPQGGVRPHNRFSVESSRAEVLFVDYIMTHLKPRGRGAIIVPEGVIFQSGGAYKKLRKLLIEDGLYAVVSLPSGVFNPYSGVKTSILFFDNQCAPKSESILFVSIKNTGVDLGASKRSIEGSDLPEALRILKSHRTTVLEGKAAPKSPIAFAVKRSVIEKTSDYNFSFERYKIAERLSRTDSDTPLVALGEISKIERGKSSSTKTPDGPYPLILTAEEWKTADNFDFDGDAVCVPLISATGHGKANLKRVHRVSGKFALANLLAAIFPKKDVLDRDYLYWVLMGGLDYLAGLMSGAANVGMKKEDLETFKIPLPPLEIQRQIALELDNYQKIIAGAREIIDSYKPEIAIDPNWKIVNLEDVVKINASTANPAEVFGEDKFFYIDISSVENHTGRLMLGDPIDAEGAPSRARRMVGQGDILLSTVRPNSKAFAYLTTVPEKVIASTGFAVLTPTEKINGNFLHALLFHDFIQNQMLERMGKGAYPSINQADVEQLRVPLPPLDIQQNIATEIAEEKKYVESANHTFELFQKKLRSKLVGVWSQ